MHRTLAEKIRDRYREDARQMDSHFFGGSSLLETALDTAVREACAEPQSVVPRDHFDRSELRSLSLMAGLTGVMLNNEAGGWPTYFHGKRIETLHASFPAGGDAAA